MKWPVHGSNPTYLYESLKITKPEEYLDFSANINPLGPPPVLRECWCGFFDSITDYPDHQARKLTGIIAEKERVEPGSVLVTNGGAELINLIARMLSGKKALIIQPAFSEYGQACSVNGCEVTYHILPEGEGLLNVDVLLPLLEEVDAVFLCTPNNPTGTAFNKTSVLRLLGACGENGCLTIIDEAFYDFMEQEFTFAQYLAHFPHLLILRSLTKMFAIPGIRLGYLLADQTIIERIKPFQPHWSVNQLALMAGEICLDDEKHVKKTRRFISEQKEKLAVFFQEQCYITSDSHVNFYLLRDPELDDQLELMKFLLNRGIVPRHTYNFPGLEGRWLRFAVKTEEDNAKLMDVLLQWRAHQ